MSRPQGPHAALRRIRATPRRRGENPASPCAGSGRGRRRAHVPGFQVFPAPQVGSDPHFKLSSEHMNAARGRSRHRWRTAVSLGKIARVADALPGKWYLGIQDGKTIVFKGIKSAQSIQILRLTDTSADIVSDYDFISLYELGRCKIILDIKSQRFNDNQDNGSICIVRNRLFIKVDRIRAVGPLYIDIRTGCPVETIGACFWYSKWSLLLRSGNEKVVLLNFGKEN